MKLRTLCIERYKGYAERAELELAPLTILVGPNNSGKTALAAAIQLFAGGLSPSEKDTSEPFPLESGGVKHGDTFADLVTGRAIHGQLQVGTTLIDDTGLCSLSAKVQNVVAPPHPSERQITNWQLTSGDNQIALTRVGFHDLSEYDVAATGTIQHRQHLRWRGLIPSRPNTLPPWTETRLHALHEWALGVRHLRCPRTLSRSPFVPQETMPSILGPSGEYAPLLLAANDELRERVRRWYRTAFGQTIDIVAQGIYSELVARAAGHDTHVPLTQSGRGLSHALPVVVMALTASTAGTGVDIIEHPEAELHPAAHADIAELLLDNLAGPERPLVIETHSEMVLLRARRWIAEGRIPPDRVLIYWVHTEPGRGSLLSKIALNVDGTLDGWPDGVFIEDYEEIMAIRRAARSNG